MLPELKNFLKNKRCTLLGAGPMSLNCVDSVIELSDKFNVPIILIASRRQIDSEYFGGGYVNNWDTKNFSKYIKTKNKKKKVILARDHGGPWQNNLEIDQKLSIKQAMESAKKSFAEDIDSNFKILHIDPSIDIFNKSKPDQILERVYELLDFCYTYASKKNKKIEIEVGTEEQNGSTNTPDELIETLTKLNKFCKKNKFPKISFVVIQAGTKVMENRNIGSFESPVRVSNELPVEIQLPKMIEICEKFGVLMKEHNTDYLSNDSLKWHPKLGIHAANVAPEFGVEETKAFIQLLKNNKLNKELDDFINISVKSNKWKKWVINKNMVNDQFKTLLCGHYIFSSEEFFEIKKRVNSKIKKSLDIDDYLKQHIKISIKRYLSNFNLI